MKKQFSGLAHRLGVVALLALAGGAGLVGCHKDDTTVSPDYTATDDALIKSYLATNSLAATAQKQASGLYFVPVLTNASAAKAAAGTNVSFLYTGTLLNGTTFATSGQDKSKAASFVLGNSTTIAGLQEGISLMHLGDKATLLIPSGLAFGASGSSTVPANTVIRLDVEVTDFNYAATDDALIQKYLTANNITTAQKQASGLYYVPVVANPTGTQATAGKTVSVLYTGKLLDGTVFDASSQHGNTPISFTLGAKQVIAGWDEGIALMHKGEKATLLIPSALAYGPTGAGTTIAPNTVLSFDVELTDVK